MFSKKNNKGIVLNDIIVNGKERILMIRTNTQNSNDNVIDFEYNEIIQEVIDYLEDKGAIILDIKFNSDVAPRANKMNDTIHTLIRYK